MTNNSIQENLWKSALEARKKSYSPYSSYAVGAAALFEDKIYTGCNVENSSYGGTICAERTAILKAVSEGERKLQKIAIVTSNAAPPCGICVQTIAEFCSPDSEIILATPEGIKTTIRFKELSPYAFNSHYLNS